MECSDLLPLIKPMLATKAEPFNSKNYIFEVKWDGYRALAYLYNGRTELRSRNFIDLSPVFPELGKLHDSVGTLPVILDGEIVVFSGNKPSFSSLQARGRLTDSQKIRRVSHNLPAVYIAFDILYAGGRWLMEMPLNKRKELLRKHVAPDNFLAISDYVVGEGIEFAKAVQDNGLEGIVAKEISSPYIPGKRSVYWKKIRYTHDADLVICGYIPGKGGRKLGALLLGGFIDGRLQYCGRVGTGFTRATEEDLLKKLKPITKNEPSINVPAEEKKAAVWVEPVLVCTVEYLEKTGQGCLRHPSFKGLRFDKDVRECQFPAGRD